MNLEKDLFRAGSKTYSSSSLLFPKLVREDVTKLYSFLRTADDYVDSKPQHLNEFRNLVASWQEYRMKPMGHLTPEPDDRLNVRVVKNICRLRIRHQFDPDWIDAFLGAMEMDTKKKTFRTLKDSLAYVRGSGEVVGLMMARIMYADGDEALELAAMMGRAFQWINFIRDIAEDVELGRNYFPKDDLKQFGLSDLGELTAKAHPDEFRAFTKFQLARYAEWQQAAEAGIHFLPRRCRPPVQAAADMYKWTARRIARDPFIVYQKKVKPGKARVVGSALSHMFD